MISRIMELDQLMMRELDAIEQSEAALMSDYGFTLDHHYQFEQQQQLPDESPDTDDDAFLIPHWTDIHELDFGLISDDENIRLNDDDALEKRLMSSMIDPADHVPITSADSTDSSESRSSRSHGDHAASIVHVTEDDQQALIRPPVIINSTILRNLLIKKQPPALEACDGGSAAVSDSTNRMIYDKHNKLNNIEQDHNLRAITRDHADAKQVSINGASKKQLKTSKGRAKNMLNESLRRKQMTRLFHTLRDLLPNKPFQNDRCMIIDEAVHHILSLEQHRKTYAQILRFLRRPRRCHMSKNGNTSSSTSLRTVFSSSSPSSSPSSSTSPSSVSGADVRHDDDDDVLAPSVKISLVNHKRDSQNITSLNNYTHVQVSIVCPTFMISCDSASTSASSVPLSNNISRRPSLLDEFISLLESRGFVIADATFSLGQHASFYSFRAQIMQETLPSSTSIDGPAFLDNLEDDLILRVASNLQVAKFLKML